MIRDRRGSVKLNFTALADYTVDGMTLFICSTNCLEINNPNPVPGCPARITWSILPKRVNRRGKSCGRIRAVIQYGQSHRIWEHNAMHRNLIALWRVFTPLSISDEDLLRAIRHVALMSGSASGIRAILFALDISA